MCLSDYFPNWGAALGLVLYLLFLVITGWFLWRPERWEDYVYAQRHMTKAQRRLKRKKGGFQGGGFGGGGGACGSGGLGGGSSSGGGGGFYGGGGMSGGGGATGRW